MPLFNRHWRRILSETEKLVILPAELIIINHGKQTLWWPEDLSDESIRSRKLERANSTLDSSSSLVLSETTSPLVRFLHSFELRSNAH